MLHAVLLRSNRHHSTSPVGTNKRLDFMRCYCPQGLSPSTAASAAAFRVAASSRRLQRTWRRFAAQRKTTTQLARTFAGLGISNLDFGEEAAAEPLADTGAAVGSTASERRSSIPGVVMIGGLSAQRPSPHHMRFEDFAAKLQSPNTLRTAQVSGALASSGCLVIVA